MSDSLQPHKLQYARLPCPSVTLSLLKLLSIESMMPSNHLILFWPPSSHALDLFHHQDLFQESALRLRWPKYWSFSFSISPYNEYSGLISFRIGWFDLAVQGTLKSLLQHHNSKASILRCSAFFMVHLSHRTWLLEKPQLWLYRLLLAKWYLCFLICYLGLLQLFFQRSKCLLISWLQSLSTVILEPKEMKSATVSILFPIYLPWNDGTRCHDLSFWHVEF